MASLRGASSGGVSVLMITSGLGTISGQFCHVSGQLTHAR